MFGRLVYELEDGSTRAVSYCERDTLRITDYLEKEYRESCIYNGALDGATMTITAIIDGESQVVISRKHFKNVGWVDVNSHLYRQLEERYAFAS